MPIYEFRCLKCNDCFEILMMNTDEMVETKCPHCDSEEFEKIMSTANHSIGAGGADSPGPSSQTRTCSGGSCTTYDIPGPS